MSTKTSLVRLAVATPKGHISTARGVVLKWIGRMTNNVFDLMVKKWDAR